MEKETFYEKLKKLEPTVKSYFDAKKIAKMPEIAYVSDKCRGAEPHLEEDKLGQYNEQSILSSRKIFRVILGVVMGWGALCIIIGISGLSAMDIILGVCICVGVCFLHRHLEGKFKEKLRIAQERTALKNEYEALVAKTKADYREIVDTLDAKHKEMSAKFDEFGLSSLVPYLNSYEDFSMMLSYAEEHPKQTTPGPCLKVLAERARKNTENEVYCRSMYSSIMHDISFESDEEEEIQDDSEARERDNSWQQYLQRQKEWEIEAKEWAEERNRKEKERMERMRLEKAASKKCSTCVNSTKCSLSVKAQSLTCSGFIPK